MDTGTGPQSSKQERKRGEARREARRGRGRGSADLGELLSEDLEFLLERRLLDLGGRHLVADLADLGARARRHHHARALARRDVRALRACVRVLTE